MNDKYAAAIALSTLAATGLFDKVPAQVTREVTGACGFPTAPTSLEQQVKATQQAAADAVAALAAQEAKDALIARLNNDRALAVATQALIEAARDLVVYGQYTTTSADSFAKFRKELQPLASSYGLKIVLVGNRSRATLVTL